MKAAAIQPENDDAEVVQAKTDAKSFAELGLCAELCQACESLGWVIPTDIQSATLPWTLQGRDIIALAETGSGKTGAFALPVLQSLLDSPQRLYCIALAPTRELCVQIADTFKALGSAISLEVCVIVGGVEMSYQSMQLAKKPHVIVASPGRLVDHLENTKGFSLGTCKYLILDEADRLLTPDFEQALDQIIRVLPSDKRALLFSATMTSKVSKLQRAALRKPVKIEVTGKYATAKNLVQKVLLAPSKLKFAYAAATLGMYKEYSGMIFSNTCLGAQKLAAVLRYLGFESVCLHGKMTQPQRMGALNALKSGRKQLLVATEVGSRGLDIPNVDLVMNFDVPLSSKDYIHRVGRTARAGRSGLAITICTEYDVEGYQRVEHALQERLPVFNEITKATAHVYQEKVMEAMRNAENELKGKKDDDDGEEGEDSSKASVYQPGLMGKKTKSTKGGKFVHRKSGMGGKR